MFERVIPSNGATICGHFSSAVASFDADPWVIGHCLEVFDNVDTIGLEWWLTDDTGQLAHMQRTSYKFGRGDRLYSGTHVLHIQIYKVGSSPLLNFEVRRRFLQNLLPAFPSSFKDSCFDWGH